MTLHQQVIIRAVKRVVDAGPYPYMNTWEDYQRAVEDWTWKIRQALAPESLCPRCKHRDDCIIYTNPYETEVCLSYDSLRPSKNEVEEE